MVKRITLFFSEYIHVPDSIDNKYIFKKLGEAICKLYLSSEKNVDFE